MINNEDDVKKLEEEYLQRADSLRYEYLGKIKKLQEEKEQKLKEIQALKQQLLREYQNSLQNINQEYEAAKNQAYIEKRKLPYIRTQNPIQASRDVFRFYDYLHQLNITKTQNIKNLNEWKTRNLNKLNQAEKQIKEYYDALIEKLRREMQSMLKFTREEVQVDYLNNLIHSKIEELENASSGKEYEKKLNELKQIANKFNLSNLKDYVKELEQNWNTFKYAVGLKGNKALVYNPKTNKIEKVEITNPSLLDAIKEKISELKKKLPSGAQITKVNSDGTVEYVVPTIEEAPKPVNLLNFVKQQYGKVRVLDAFSDLEGEKVVFEKNGEKYMAVYNPYDNKIDIFKEAYSPKTGQVQLQKEKTISKKELMDIASDLGTAFPETFPFAEYYKILKYTTPIREQIFNKYAELMSKIDEEVPKAIDNLMYKLLANYVYTPRDISEGTAIRKDMIKLTDEEKQKLKEYIKNEPVTALTKFAAGFGISFLQNFPSLAMMFIAPEKSAKAMKQLPQYYKELWKKDKAYALGQLTELITTPALALIEGIKLKLPKLTKEEVPEVSVRLPKEIVEEPGELKLTKPMRAYDIPYVKFREHFLSPKDYMAGYKIVTREIKLNQLLKLKSPEYPTIINKDLLKNIKGIFISNTAKIISTYDRPLTLEAKPLSSVSLVVKAPEVEGIKLPHDFVITKARGGTVFPGTVDVVTFKYTPNSYLHRIFIHGLRDDVGLGITFKVGNKLLTYIKTLRGQELIGVDKLSRAKTGSVVTGIATVGRLTPEFIDSLLKRFTKREIRAFKEKVLPKLEEFRQKDIKTLSKDLNQLMKQQKRTLQVTKTDVLVSQATAEKIFQFSEKKPSKVIAKEKPVAEVVEPKEEVRLRIKVNKVGKNRFKIELPSRLKESYHFIIRTKSGLRIIPAVKIKQIAAKNTESVHNAIVGIVKISSPHKIKSIKINKQIIQTLQKYKVKLNTSYKPRVSAKAKAKTTTVVPILDIKIPKPGEVKIDLSKYTRIESPEYKLESETEKAKRKQQMVEKKIRRKRKKKKARKKGIKARLKTKFFRKKK